MNHILLYVGVWRRNRLQDNGVVSVVMGKIDNEELHIDLWLMSCRVLKRDMEYAMMDTLVKKAYQSWY